MDKNKIYKFTKEQLDAIFYDAIGDFCYSFGTPTTKEKAETFQRLDQFMGMHFALTEAIDKHSKNTGASAKPSTL